jgi:cysteine desulfuration protein SufE
MKGSIESELEALQDEFQFLDDWEDRYRHVIDLGRALTPLEDEERNDANKVLGCSSQVWLVTEHAPDGVLRFRGDSDSSLVRGLIAVLLRLYSGHPPSEILAFDVKAAFEALGFKDALSAQRSNGFFSMIGRVRRDAEASASGV